MPKSTKKSLAFGVAFVAFLISASSSFLLIYLVFLQPGMTLSLKRIAIAAFFGVLIAASTVFLLFKAYINQKLAAATLLKTFGLAVILCAILWLMAPTPTNYLFAPQGRMDVTVHRTSADQAGATQITLLSNGLDYIPLRSVQFKPAIPTPAKGQELDLVFDAAGNAHFSWQGRSWKSIQVNFNSTQAIEVTFISGNVPITNLFIPGTVLTLNIPVRGVGYYTLIQLLVVLASIFSLWILLAALGVIQVEEIGAWLNSKLGWAPGGRVLNLLVAVTFSAFVAIVVSIGFQNRLYADDYCSLFELRQVGYLNAVVAWFHVMTGRFSAHVFNFLAFEFPGINTVIGPVTALVCIGGSLYFLFLQLLGSSGRRQRIQLSALFSITLLGTFFLSVPFLYESFVWNIHSITVSAGFGCFVIAFAFFVRILKSPNHSRHSLLWGLLFFLVGFIGAGFNEIVGMLDILLFGIILVILLIQKTPDKHKTTFICTSAYLLGSGIGLVVSVLAPGDSQRLVKMGFSAQLASLITWFYRDIQTNTADILSRNQFLPLLLILFVLGCAYFWGQSLTAPLPWVSRKFSFFEKSLLVILPFLIFFIAFLPSAFVSGYFPERTLAFPLAYSLTAAFLAALTLGNARPRNLDGNKVLALVLPVLLMVVCVLSFKYLLNFSRQMSFFGPEWDARNQQIEAAVAAGQSEFTVTPYLHSPGTDVSTKNNLWLPVCESNYYGINLVVNDK